MAVEMETFGFLLSVWLTRWSSDPRALDTENFTWRNIYISVYGGLGVIQGAMMMMKMCENLFNFIHMSSCGFAGNIGGVCDWMPSGGS